MSAAAGNLKPWKPGQSGNPGGKPKLLFPRPAEILNKMGKEPIAELMKLLPMLKEQDQAKVWLEILPYIHAKAKPLDEGEEDELAKMSTAELLSLVKSMPEAK